MVYDDYCARNAAVRWARDVIRQQVLAHTASGSAMLELNAGTGEDALFFAQHGRHAHAIDIADGMVVAMAQKSAAADASFTTQQLSFTELNCIADPRQAVPKYQLVFSNFGGLNCIADLRQVTRHLPPLLVDGAYVVWVVMPPICPWELAQAVRGQFKTAFRRLHPHGTLAHVEGAYFRTHYFTPSQVMHALGPQFRLRGLHGIGVFSPPSFLEGFPQRLPRLFGWLCRCDETLARRWPFNRMGDYIMLTAQFCPDV